MEKKGFWSTIWPTNEAETCIFRQTLFFYCFTMFWRGTYLCSIVIRCFQVVGHIAEVRPFGRWKPQIMRKMFARKKKKDVFFLPSFSLSISGWYYFFFLSHPLCLSFDQAVLFSLYKSLPCLFRFPAVFCYMLFGRYTRLSLFQPCVKSWQLVMHSRVLTTTLFQNYWKKSHFRVNPEALPLSTVIHHTLVL